MQCVTFDTPHFTVYVAQGLLGTHQTVIVSATIIMQCSKLQILLYYVAVIQWSTSVLLFSVNFSKPLTIMSLKIYSSHNGIEPRKQCIIIAISDLIDLLHQASLGSHSGKCT